MNIKNHTSEMPPAKSLGLIEELLVEAGASNINKEFRDKMPYSISFLMPHKGETLAFRLTSRQDAVFRLLWKKVKKPQNGTMAAYEAQAWRTAWKNIYDLVAAQIAILLTEQASSVELFLPYLLDKNNAKTFAERLEEDGQLKKLLT